MEIARQRDIGNSKAKGYWEQQGKGTLEIVRQRDIWKKAKGYWEQ